MGQQVPPTWPALALPDLTGRTCSATHLCRWQSWQPASVTPAGMWWIDGLLLVEHGLADADAEGYCTRTW